MSAEQLHTQLRNKCGAAPQSLRRGREGMGMEEEWRTLKGFCIHLQTVPAAEKRMALASSGFGR